MNVKRTRTTLWLTTLALTAAAGAIVAFHFTHPRKMTTTETERTGASIREAEARAITNAAQADAEVLEQLAGRDYRQRLFDPPVVVASPPPPKPVPPVQLISTILRPGGGSSGEASENEGSRSESSAWVRDGQATRKVVIGDTVGPENNPATVTGIEADQLILDHEGREARIARDAGGGSRR